jgi:hypothetical protein
VRSPKRIIIITAICIGILLSCGHILNKHIIQSDPAGVEHPGLQGPMHSGSPNDDIMGSDFNDPGSLSPWGHFELPAVYSMNPFIEYNRMDTFNHRNPLHQDALALLARLTDQDDMLNSISYPESYFASNHHQFGIEDYILPDDDNITAFSQSSGNQLSYYFFPSFYIPDPVRAGLLPPMARSGSPARNPQDLPRDVTPVPEPSTIFLFGISLLVLLSIGRRKISQ